jgi:hypothetical protein
LKNNITERCHRIIKPAELDREKSSLDLSVFGEAKKQISTALNPPADRHSSMELEQSCNN